MHRITRQQSTILFIDVLGVGSATERLDAALKDRLEEDLQIGVDLFVDHPLRADIAPDSVELWSRAIVLFPVILAHAAALMKEVDKRPLGDIQLFSDCAFVCFRCPLAACFFTSYAMGAAAQVRVPLRAGIAKGSYWSFDLSSLFQRKPGSAAVQEMHDYLWEHNLLANRRFLGSAVTRSYLAESSGFKGMRALLHESLVEDVPSRFLINLPASDLASLDKWRPSVSKELNWLLVLHEWKQRAHETRPRTWIPLQGQYIREKLCDRVVADLERWYDPERAHKAHYDATWASMANCLKPFLEMDSSMFGPLVRIPFADLSLRDAIARFEVSRTKLLQLLRTGNIEGRKIKGKWRITPYAELLDRRLRSHASEAKDRSGLLDLKHRNG